MRKTTLKFKAKMFFKRNPKFKEFLLNTFLLWLVCYPVWVMVNQIHKFLISLI